jgi:hypothetical protein
MEEEEDLWGEKKYTQGCVWKEETTNKIQERMEELYYSFMLQKGDVNIWTRIHLSAVGLC